jgi:hypothetical protein
VSSFSVILVFTFEEEAGINIDLKLVLLAKEKQREGKRFF